MEWTDSVQNISIANISMQFLMRNKENNSSNCYGYTLGSHLNNSETSYMPAANIFFHKLSKSSEKSEVSFMFDNNVRKKFENFTKYINGKEHSFMKDTMDHWNQLSTGYSEFFTSSKGYSYVSNSIASYLIGGFVGSKSQMNNDKHKLSYDLGEVIFKILNDYKYDKNYEKLREEKKCEASRIGKKSKSWLKEPVESLECDYNMAIWNSLVDKPQNCEQILNINSFNETIVNEESSKKLSQAAVQIICDNKTILSSQKSSDGENWKSADIENKNILCLNTPLNNNDCSCLQKLDNNNIRSNLNERITLDGTYKTETGDTLETEKHKHEINFSSISSPCGNSLLESRKRQYSECSIESTDSESFIVFEDRCCDSSYEELPSFNFQESEYDESDWYCEEEDDCDNADDVEDSCWIRSNDECDNLFEDERGKESEVKQANRRWSDIYKDVNADDDDDDDDECLRKVRFNEKIKVHRIIAWDYAYRAARHGPWEQMVRDRDRFKERIRRLSYIISPVLHECHRKSIYDKFYA